MEFNQLLNIIFKKNTFARLISRNCGSFLFRHWFFLPSRVWISIWHETLLLAAALCIILVTVNTANSKLSVTIFSPIWKPFPHTSIILSWYCPFPFFPNLFKASKMFLMNVFSSIIYVDALFFSYKISSS